MAELFPTSLQELVNQSGFNHAFGDTAIRSENEIGLAKTRQRYTKSIDVFTTSIDMPIEEYSTLSDFFKTTLSGGSKTFLYDHPMTEVESEFRFISPPTIAPMGGRYFKVNMQWELIP